MTVLQHNPFLIASGNPTDPTFPLQRSVRLRSSASAYFNRTLTTPTNNLKWTWSGWVKRGGLGAYQTLFCGDDGSSNNFLIFRFGSADTLECFQIASGTYNLQVATAAVWRDPSAWYHIVVVYDSANATSTDRIQIYVNNVRQTLSYAVGPFAVNTVSQANVASRNHAIGRILYSSLHYLDGYLTEVNFIDGQALKPIAFGGYNPGTGAWEPRKYSGAYGTNGFYLPLSNPASIGADGSGNGNNWTANAIQTTNSALATYDSMLDVPTNTSPTNSNFAVLSPIARSTFVANSSNPGQGNLDIYQASISLWAEVIATIGVSSGKWYWEIITTNLSASANLMLGVVTEAEFSNLAVTTKYVGSNTAGYGYYSVNGNKYYNGVATAYGGAYVTNDVVGVALDMDAGTLTFYKNGVSQGIAFSGLTGTIFPAFSSVGAVGQVNFGQQPFKQTVPTGHKSLNLFNLSDPAIKQPVSVHNLYTYTGNGGGLQVGEIQKPMSLFNLDRSIRIRAAVNAYFSRLPTVNGNGQKFTISTWIKRGKLGTGWTDTIFTGRTGTNFPELDIMFSTDLIKLQAYTTGAALLMNVDTVNLYRDTNMWYHVVTAFDTTQAVAADRVKVYVNGVAQTIAAGATYPSQNLVLNANQTVTQYIGSSPANTAWGDLYFADYYMIDGQQLTPDSFGQFDGNYYWTPKAYSGTYGTNGWHLEFEDFSGITATTIGKDTSGNGNNWTPTGINLTTPEVDNEYWDSYTDVPTLKDADTCNYCTLDPLQASSSGLRNGNLTAVWTTASTAFKQRGTYALKTGKWYFEGNLEAFVIGNAGNTNYAIGFITTSGVDTHVSFGWTTNGTSMKLGYRYDVAGAVVQNVTYNTVTPVSTDIFGIEYDVDNGTANFYKNGTLMGSASGLALGEVNPHIWRSGTSNSATMHVNFGQRAFKYTPSTGYKKINSFNVAEVLGDVESPDFVWIKSRGASGDHALFNSVTGVGKYLRTSNAVLEVNDVNSLIQFNKNGFLLGNAAIANASATTFVASAWKIAATTVTNTNGSVTSQVRANQTSGISIATFTAAASGNFTVGHGLNVAPSMVILKNRGATDSFYVYNRNFATPTTHYLQMNSTSVILSSASIWGSTNPTSSVVTLGAGGGIAANASGIIYCFSDVAGFSKFGSYISNNASDGPFVYTGFRPRWLMVKRAMTTAGAAGWFMYDAARNTYNVMDKYLFAEGTAAENTLGVVDFTANGFKIRSNNVHINTTAGDTYIFLAFAENPFKYALAR